MVGIVRAKFSVAGKKGKMMERRILKDFQIGIVESISEAVKNASGDVFTSIAKAINKRSVHRKYVIHFVQYLWLLYDFVVNLSVFRYFNHWIRFVSLIQ